MRTGRPSKLTEKVTLEITRYISEGLPFKYACNLAGIGESTGYEWLRDNETFRSQVECAKSKAVLHLIHVVRKNSNGAWKLLKNLGREHFQDTNSVNIQQKETDSEENKIDLSQYSDDQLAQLEAILSSPSNVKVN